LAVVSILATGLLAGNPTWAGLPTALTTLGAAAASFPLSMLMGRLGRRPGLMTGYLVAATGALIAVCAIAAGSFLFLLPGMLLLGVGNSSNQLGRYAAADVSLVANRGKAISLVVWGSTIGAVAGPNLPGLVGPLMHALGLPDLAGPYVLGIFLFSIAALLIWALLRPDPMHVARTLESGTRGTAEPAAPRALKEILAQPLTQIALAAMIASHFTMVSLMAMTPVHMHDHGFTLQAVGVVISGHVLGMYGFAPLSGWVADRFGRVKATVAGGCLLLTALLSATAAAGQNQALLMLGLFLLGLGWNFGFVSGSALLTESVQPMERARMQGLADSTMGGVAAIGAVSSGVILQLGGYGLIAVAGALMVAFPLTTTWVNSFRMRLYALA
jgi:MFS family permease